MELSKKIQTFSYKISRREDLMYKMVTIADNTVLYERNFLREYNVNVLIKRRRRRRRQRRRKVNI